MKMYRAITKSGLPIVTVFSDGDGPSLGDAISRELNRPGNSSRQALYDTWVRDGMLTEEVKRDKTFKVYHTKDWEISSKLHFDTEGYKPKKSDYREVATVICKELGDVFRITNHIDREWWKNDEVVFHEESRSTSVGDLVEDENGKLHLCASVGWEDVEWDDEPICPDDPNHIRHYLRETRRGGE